jgi:hypothetical protein
MWLDFNELEFSELSALIRGFEQRGWRLLDPPENAPVPPGLAVMLARPVASQPVAA